MARLRNDAGLDSSKLKFGFWNIRGFKSRTIGNKLISKDFLREINGYDIVGLAETHIHSYVLDDLHIPGFVRLQYINRQYNPKSKTAPGGLAVFCKEDIKEYVNPVKSKNENILWVNIKKEFTGLGKDIYLGTLYFTPSGNKESVQKIYQSLEENILCFQRKGLIILQGDFNAHTNSVPDYTESDNFVEGSSDTFQHPVSTRNSEDNSQVDMRGEELLELCKSLNLNILNGRKLGDIFGKLTSFQWNGQSVVDYVVTSYELFPFINYFAVGGFSPWISDHCPLHFKLQLQEPKTIVPKENIIEYPKRFYLSNCDKLKLTETPKTKNISDILDPSKWPECRRVEDLASVISNTLISVTEMCNIKSKTIKERLGSNKPWFDKECLKLKNSIKRKCKQLKNTPHDNNLKLTIFSENKTLRKLILRKKNEYKLNILKDMHLKKGDQKAFWRLLDKLEPPCKNNDSIYSISGGKWKRHFKSLLQSNRQLEYPPNFIEPGPLDYIITPEELSNASYVLKSNKATGFDSISNEMIICLLEANSAIFLKLFNSILKQNAIVSEWTTSIINPIHKGGSKTDLANFRGISILSCLGK